jgi:hypothetical protein
MSGASLTTKGLVSSGKSSAASSTGGPPTFLGSFGLSPTNGTVVIVVPTAINTPLLASENIVDNLRLAKSANVVLPSLYKRAFFITYETDETAVIKPPT